MSAPTHIRGTHWAAFRTGEWAEILTIVPSRGRDCYLVRFPDGATDWWAIDDPSEPYEFKQAAKATGEAPQADGVES